MAYMDKRIRKVNEKNQKVGKGMKNNFDVESGKYKIDRPNKNRTKALVKWKERRRFYCNTTVIGIRLIRSLSAVDNTVQVGGIFLVF